MRKSLVWLGLVGAGAAIMYVVDTITGRRAMPPCALAMRTFCALERWPESLGGKIQTRALARRVRSEIDRTLGHPHAIAVEVANGRVSLRGGLRAEEVDRLTAQVAAVPGVRTVESHLVALESMEDGMA